MNKVVFVGAVNFPVGKTNQIQIEGWGVK